MLVQVIVHGPLRQRSQVKQHGTEREIEQRVLFNRGNSVAVHAFIQIMQAAYRDATGLCREVERVELPGMREDGIQYGEQDS